MVCQLTLGVGLACPGCNVFVQSAMVRRCVMSGMLCLSVQCCSTSGKSTHGCSQGQVRTMQQFMWQSDIVGVVYYVRDSLLVLLADGEGGDRSSNQP